MIKFKLNDSIKWTPGKRLDSAAEVMQALLDGERIALDFWRPECFVQLKDKKLIDEVGKDYRLDFYDFYDWYIYTPPKRKVKSERWFAVHKDQSCEDGVSWRGPYVIEAAAKRENPNALAYVRTECEVEVEVDGNG